MIFCGHKADMEKMSASEKPAKRVILGGKHFRRENQTAFDDTFPAKA